MQTPNFFIHQLTKYVSAVVAKPHVALVLAALVTAAAGFYALDHLKVNASRDALIDPSSSFLADFNAFQDVFPLYRRTIVVLVEAESGQKAADGARALNDVLKSRTDLYSSIFTPAAEPFFRDHGLLYLDTDELEKVVADLTRAQPALAALAKDPSLRGLFGLLTTALDARDRGEALPASFIDLTNRLAEASEGVTDNTTEKLNWGGLFGSGEFGPKLQVITLQAKGDAETKGLTANAAVQAVRDAAVTLGLTPDAGYTVRLTGSVPLADEEMSAVTQSIGMSGIFSIIFLGAMVIYGVRSVRMIAAIFATLFGGLVCTLGWAAATVGELNLISSTFAVLFLGIGVDFAIHVTLRLQQALLEGNDVKPGLVLAAASVGGAVVLNALTAAVGFLSFVPTGYTGVGDLGVIAGGGMVIAVIATLTVLPAVLAVTGAPRRRAAKWYLTSSGGGVFGLVERHAKAASVWALVLAVISGLIATQAKFDVSTLSLKDPKAESLVALKRLQEEGIATDYAVFVVADSITAAAADAAKLGTLDVIKSVETPDSYLPKDQDDKLALLDEVSFTLLPALQVSGKAKPLTAKQRASTVDKFIGRLDTALGSDLKDDALRQALTRLAGALKAMRQSPDRDAHYVALEQAVTADVNAPLDYLRTALQVGPVTFDDLPQDVRDRIVAKNGQVRIVGIPSGDMTNSDEEITLVTEVQKVFPHATGRPVLEVGFGNVVIAAFRQAILIAIAAIVVILLVTLRNLTDVVLVTVPLLIAASLTAATSVLVDIPFNLANVIVIPLILGLGVACGSYVILRYHQYESMEGLLRSSTPRAVIVSTLTTIGAFGALSISVHHGIRSMGLLLTVAMAYLLLSTVVILPAFLHLRSSGGAAGNGRRRQRRH